MAKLKQQRSQAECERIQTSTISVPTEYETRCPDDGGNGDDDNNEEGGEDEDEDEDDDDDDNNDNEDPNTDGDPDWFDIWRLEKRQRLEGRCSTETLYSISTSTEEDR